MSRLINRSLPIVFAIAVLGLNSAFAATTANSQRDFTETFSMAQEVAPVNPTTPAAASALGHFSFDTQSHVLNFSIDYHNLSGAPTMAHIHNAGVNQNGPVVELICAENGASLLGKCPQSNNGSLTGKWLVPDSLVSKLLNGEIYFNFHTSLNMTGEIRAQLHP